MDTVEAGVEHGRKSSQTVDIESAEGAHWAVMKVMLMDTCFYAALLVSESAISAEITDSSYTRVHLTMGMSLNTVSWCVDLVLLHWSVYFSHKQPENREILFVSLMEKFDWWKLIFLQTLATTLFLWCSFLTLYVHYIGNVKMVIAHYKLFLNPTILWLLCSQYFASYGYFTLENVENASCFVSTSIIYVFYLSFFDACWLRVCLRYWICPCVKQR